MMLTEVLFMAVLKLLLITAGLIVGLVLLFKPPAKKETTQELLNYKEISEDGIIELEDSKFKLVIEVTPINMFLRSFEEQAAIWAGFREAVNSLTLPCTFLIQTRYVNIKEYLESLKQTARGLAGELKSYADDLTKHLNSLTEGKSLRDKRCFLILHADRKTVANTSIRVENELVDTLVKSFSTLKNVKGTMTGSSEDIRLYAHKQLEEARDLIISALSGIGITAEPLGKKQVLEMLYQTFNRETASFIQQDFDEPPLVLPVSSTPEKVLSQFSEVDAVAE